MVASIGRKLESLLCLLPLALFLGCGGGGSSTDPKSAYSPPSDNASIQFVRKNADSSQAAVQASIVGTKEINGESFSRLLMNETSPDKQRSTEVWIQRPNDHQVEIAGGEIFSKSLDLGQGSHPLLTGTLDKPFLVDLDTPVGKSVKVDVSADVVLLGTTSVKGQAQGDYTLIEDGVALDTGLGSISGCKHFQGSVTLGGEGLPTALTDLQLSGDLWYHPQYGIVGAVIHRPPLPDVEIGYNGSSDSKDLDGGYRMNQKMEALDSTHGSLRLNTYDLHQQFDADKNTHAKMLLELRFSDEERAKTSEQPSVSIEFGTALGTYPAQLLQSSVSFFHPGERGKGYAYWIAFVDQAAKNEASNPIAYHIIASLGSASQKVRATARILYKALAP
jgi:hypothetical protein